MNELGAAYSSNTKLHFYVDGAEKKNRNAIVKYGLERMEMWSEAANNAAKAKITMKTAYKKEMKNEADAKKTVGKKVTAKRTVGACVSHSPRKVG